MNVIFIDFALIYYHFIAHFVEMNNENEFYSEYMYIKKGEHLPLTKKIQNGTKKIAF